MILCKTNIYIYIYTSSYAVYNNVYLYTTYRRAVRVILNMLLVIDSLTAFGTSKYEYREYTTNFFFNLGQYCTCASLVKFNNI